MTDLEKLPTMSPEPRPIGPRRFRRLSPDEQAAVEAGYLDGLSIYDLGEYHGISRKTVSAILHRRGVPMRRTGLDEQQRVDAVRLYGAGHSTLMLGERFGVDPKTIARTMHRMGLQLRPAPGR